MKITRDDNKVIVGLKDEYKSEFDGFERVCFDCCNMLRKYRWKFI